MRFDYTNGNRPTHCVSVYNWSLNDIFYYDDYEKAKAKYDTVSAKKWSKGTIVSLNDMTKGERKEHVRF